LALLWTFILVSAVVFWLSVCSARPAQWWQAIVALLVTGKLACLLGALLVFAPRPIYSGHHGFDLADQQMAGLLMLAACPLSYVLAGIVVAVETLGKLGDRPVTALNRPAAARQTA
jgi:putative membrane protein